MLVVVRVAKALLLALLLQVLRFNTLSLCPKNLKSHILPQGALVFFRDSSNYATVHDDSFSVFLACGLVVVLMLLL